MPNPEELPTADLTELTPVINYLDYKVGAYIDERFQVQERYSSNPLTEVYKTTDWEGDGEVAVKIFHEIDDVSRIRVARELDIHRLLGEEPGILSAKNIDHVNPGQRSYQYVATEFMNGGSLIDQYDDSNLDIDDALEMAEQIAMAAEIFRKNQVFHGDIKLSNIYVSSAEGNEKRYMLGDYGRAEAIPEAQRSEPVLRGLGSVAWDSRLTPCFSTRGYMGHEYFDGKTPLTPKVDVFALGATVYKLVAGRSPFPATDMATYGNAVMNEKPTPAIVANRRIPLKLDLALMHALDKPEDRSTMPEFRQELLAV